MKKMLTLCLAAMLTLASGYAQDKMEQHDKMDKMDHSGKKKSKDKMDKMDHNGKMDDKKTGDKMHKMDDKKAGDKMDKQ